MLNRRYLIATALTLALGVAPALAQDKSIVVSSTTSTQDSGLFGHILPLFKQKTGIDVKVVSQGTGQALDTGRRGDADVVFVHAKSQEEKFVAEGYGVKRNPVMYNDFVIIGPKSDPAGIKGTRISSLRSRRSRTSRPTSSRAATSPARITPSSTSGRQPASTSRRTRAPWYKEIGQGMGAALNTASAVERLRAGRPRHLDQLQEQGRPRDRGRGRQAAVQPVRRHPGEPAKASQREEGPRPAIHRLADLGPEGQNAIADYKIDGQQLFFPNATDPGA